MSQKEKLIELINALSKRAGESESKYSEIKEELQGRDAIPSEVVVHITNMLSNYDTSVLSNVFPLLDYLSGKHPEKLTSLLKSEEFFEKLSFLIYEPLYKSKILSLVKYWSLVYEKQLSDYPHLGELISNLKSYDIELPSDPILFYCEKSWGGSKSKQNAQPYVQEPDEENQTNYYGPPDSFNATVPAAMGTNAAGITVNTNPAGYPPPNPNYYLGAAAQMAYPTTNYSSHAANSSNSMTNYGNNVQNQSTDIMTLEELINYKTEQCKYGPNCSSKPTNSYANSYRNESLLCPGYHSGLDKRRSLFGKQVNGGMNQFDYLAKQCQSSSCNLDQCNLAHGFFEFRFHPENYKQFECSRSVAPACIAGKFCPFYHNSNERQAWNNILSHYFGINRGDMDGGLSDETQVALYDPSMAAQYNAQYPSLQEAAQSGNRSSQNDASAEKKAHTEKIIYIDVKSKLIKVNNYLDPEKLKGFSLQNLTFSPFIDPEVTLKCSKISTDSKIDSLSSTNLKEKYNTAKNFAPKYL